MAMLKVAIFAVLPNHGGIQLIYEILFLLVLNV